MRHKFSDNLKLCFQVRFWPLKIFNHVRWKVRVEEFHKYIYLKACQNWDTEADWLLPQIKEGVRFWKRITFLEPAVVILTVVILQVKASMFWLFWRSRKLPKFWQSAYSSCVWKLFSLGKHFLLHRNASTKTLYWKWGRGVDIEQEETSAETYLCCAIGVAENKIWNRQDHIQKLYQKHLLDRQQKTKLHSTNRKNCWSTFARSWEALYKQR